MWLINSYWTHSANKQYLQRQIVLSKWLPILVFSKGKPASKRFLRHDLRSTFKRRTTTTGNNPCRFREADRGFHPTRRPVVDPCGGAFTTAVACDRLKRRFIGCDIDEQCVKIGIARLHDDRKRRNGLQSMPLDDEGKVVPFTSRPIPRVRDFRRAVLGSGQPMQKL